VPLLISYRLFNPSLAKTKDNPSCNLLKLAHNDSFVSKIFNKEYPAPCRLELHRTEPPAALTTDPYQQPKQTQEVTRNSYSQPTFTHISHASTMAVSQKLYPRATIKRIIKAHSKRNVSKNVDVLVRNESISPSLVRLVLRGWRSCYSCWFMCVCVCVRGDRRLILGVERADLSGLYALFAGVSGPFISCQ